MTNQMPALLVQHALWTQAANCELRTAPSVHLKIKMATIKGKMHYISMISQKPRGTVNCLKIHRRSVFSNDFWVCLRRYYTSQKIDIFPGKITFFVKFLK